jgi:hypothetical protein
MMPLQPSVRFLVMVATVCGLLLSGGHAQPENSQRAAIPSGPYRIAGTVTNAKTGSVLSHATVTVSDATKRENEQMFVTGDDGRFEFQVPAGKYSLQGAHRGFNAGYYDQHEEFWTGIVTGADLGTEDLALRLAPDGVLTGKVLDEFAEPVRGAQIMVYREDHSEGVSRIVRASGAATDDQGRYEVAPLIEGTYFVSVSTSPWYAVHPASNGEGAATPSSQVDGSLDVVYPISYYGDAIESEDAAPIPLRGGDRLEADIHLSPVPAMHLIVHLPEDGSGGVHLPMLQKPVFDGLEPVGVSNVQNVAPGVYEMTGIASGRYTVQAVNSKGEAKEPIDVNLNGGSELDASIGRSTSMIVMAVQVEGAANPPAQFRIGLRNNRGTMTLAELDAKGMANFSDITPGKYEVLAFPQLQTQSYSVLRIASEAGTISGHELNVPAGASLTIAVSLVGSSASVEGFAKRAGKGVSGAMIVLVPKNPETDHDLFRRDQSDLDGSFSLKNVIPGSYSIIAIENGWDLDWAVPAVLAGYLKHGQTVAVEGRAQTTVHLTNVVEVQAK